MKKALFLLLILALVLLPGCAGKETAPETTPASLWEELLPWGEEWTCLLLGGREPSSELEPESGKEALRALLESCAWMPEEAGEEDGPPFRKVVFWCGESSSTLTLNEQGEARWNGTLYRPQGEGAGEKLLADFDALLKTGIVMHAPPPLTLRCGGETAQAKVYGTYSWSYISRAGWGTGCMSDAFTPIESIDWLGKESPVQVLPGTGEVTLSFSGRVPDTMWLYAFGEAGTIPVALDGLTFIPYAGVNTYELSVWWDRADQGGFGNCTYILAVEGSCPSQVLPDSGMKAELTLLSADTQGCGLTLTNGADRDFNLESFALLRRTEDRGWAWMMPRRKAEDPRLVFKPGKAVSFRLDWSRYFGDLEAGEYAFLLSGYVSGVDSGKPQYLSLPFTLGEDALPQVRGPLTRQELPEEIASRLITQSRHRLTQTLTLTGEGKYAVETDFALFRLERDGTLTPILPEYALPADLDQGGSLTRRSNTLDLDVELARFGALETGEYVVRRRLLPLGSGENSADWRLIPPEDRVLYVDTSFYTSGPRYTDISAVAGRVEPILPSPVYYAPFPNENRGCLPAPLHIFLLENGRFNAAGAVFTVKNLGERTYTYYTQNFTLFFREDKEWLPLEREWHLRKGRDFQTLAPGESALLRFQVSTAGYPSLAPGDYRLVLPLSVSGAAEPEWLVAEFRVLKDGSGEYTGEELELEAVLRDYAITLGAAYRHPEGLIWPWNTWSEQQTRRDTYVQSWRLRRERDRFVVTVYRDGDVARAEKLLKGYDNVTVVRGEGGSTFSSEVTEENLGLRGELRAECVEQTDPRLHRESIWALTFRWDGEETARFVAYYPERLFGDKWKRLGARAGTVALDAAHMVYIPLEPGENVLEIDLGDYRAEFPPEGEYRFALGVQTPEGGVEYYTCPFAITLEGEA